MIVYSIRISAKCQYIETLIPRNLYEIKRSWIRFRMAENLR